ncbi:MAG: acyltransferase [Armatimonadetes bacterium]|nr:acyltransferase [Akkermansiaceae bacterium]
MKKFQHVDALRGIAVLLVVLVHCGQQAPPEQVFSQISRFGQYGVQLFFVMSAFTLCHSMKKTEELNPREYLSFMTRRFFRIAPLYYLAIPGYFVFSYLCLRYIGRTPFTLPADYSFMAVAANVLFLHGLYPPGNNSIVPGGWSIGTEFLFYAVFPFLFILSRRNRLHIGYAALVSLLATIFLVFIRWKIGKTGEIGMNDFIRFSVFNQFPCFALGMLYYFYSKNRSFERAVKILAPISAVFLVVPHNWQSEMIFTPFCVGICSVGLALVLENSRIPHLIARIGQLSFSIYILHFIPVFLVGKLYKLYFPVHFKSELVSILMFAAIAGITYLMAMISNRFVELPCIAIGHSFSSRFHPREPAQQPQTTTVAEADVAQPLPRPVVEPGPQP